MQPLFLGFNQFAQIFGLLKSSFSTMLIALLSLSFFHPTSPFLFCCFFLYLPTISPIWTLALAFSGPSFCLFFIFSSFYSLPPSLLLTPSSEEGVWSSGSCGGVVLSCTDKLNRRTVLVRPVSKQDSFSHFTGFFPPVRIQCFFLLNPVQLILLGLH